MPEDQVLAMIKKEEKFKFAPSITGARALQLKYKVIEKIPAVKFPKVLPRH